ncbi:MAG: CoA transferase, partial [Chloroflexota bacterium]
LPALAAFDDAEAMADPASVKRVIASRMPDKTTEEWITLLAANDVWCGRVNSYADVEAHPQVVSMGLVEEIDHPTAGTLRVLRSPVRMNGEANVPLTAPPTLGQHTEEILRDLGYNDAEISAMRESGAV